MMNDPLISVIIPVYKAEAYLEKCVNSIINQTYKNLEIILVDDGSPDNSGHMCDEYAKADSRIKVIHKENGGQSSARNVALDVMTGEYVGFVDSDDWIEPDMFEQLMCLIKEHSAEIAVCGVQCDWADGKVIYCDPDYPKCKDVEHWTKFDALKNLALNQKISNALWNKLFEKRIFDGIRMREGSVYEDFEIMPKCVEKSDNIVYDPTPLYHYIMTEESTTRGAFQKRRFIEADISREIVERYKKHYPELTKYVIAHHVEICLVLVHESAAVKEYDDIRNELIHEIRQFKACEFFGYLSKKAKLKFCAFRLGVKFYMWFMNLYQKYKA